MKKLLSTILSVLLILSALPLGIFSITVNAATDGYYTYSVSNGEATINGCNTSISGDVVIPSTLGGYPVTSIGFGAFSDCSSLTSITIPDSVTSIDDYAFSHCSSLTSITIGNSVTIIGDYAFWGCSSLTSITIPNSVTSIGDSAFSDCSSLTSITIPDSVTIIGDFAFSDCNSLNRVNITDIAAWCNIDFDYSYSNPLYYAKNLYINGTLATKLEIPNTVTAIKDYAFSYCSSLTSITIGNSVTSIGKDAFWDCSSLTKVNITDLAAWCNIDFNGYESNPLFYAENVYINGILATELEIPNTVTEIKKYAFSFYNSLTSITIPDSVTSIGTAAFSYCRSLTSITIPDSVTSISRSAFIYCSSLTSITIPDSVTSIDDYVFYNCTKLTSITIPDSVTSIGESAFYNCSSIKNIYFEGTTEEWENITVLSGNDYLKNATVHCNTTEVPDEIASVTIKKLPDKLKYIIGEELDLTGAKIAVEYPDGNYEIFDITAEMISGYNPQKCGVQVITVDYNGYKSQFSITVSSEFDINGDGDMNAYDLINLKTILLSGNTDYESNKASDLNGDEKINILDVVRLKKVLANCV